MTTHNKPDKKTKAAWHDDPANWKWGIFYYNKADKRLFPPKKIKQLGWTVNLANPLSILAILALIAAAVLIPLYLKR